MITLIATKQAAPKLGQRIRMTGRDSGPGTVTAVKLNAHTEFGHSVSVAWDDGRKGAFFTQVSQWSASC